MEINIFENTGFGKMFDEQLIRFRKDENDRYEYDLSASGKKCHFLQFLINSSNFTWKKEDRPGQERASSSVSPEELQENTLHLLSKLCAMGYLLLDFKDPNTAKAVVGIDGKQSEEGAFKGRSGKSLFGEALRQCKQTVSVKGRNLDTDVFLWEEVTKSTKIVFIDDVRRGFKFERLHANIAGEWVVNHKNRGRFFFPFASSPKIYITTNHVPKGSRDSTKARQWLIAFSDYYNDVHQPKDDFGILFFQEWDAEQWNLFWNLMDNCVQLYLDIGVARQCAEKTINYQFINN